MGEAKRKQAARERAMTALAQIDLDRVATAVRKLFSAASPVPGCECCLYAQFGQHLLQRLGVNAEVAIGYAAWRVGNAPGDVIAHHASHAPQATGPAVPYHAWIDVAGRVIDFTTHDLIRKGTMLDAQDGGRTDVKWCPEFLFAEKHELVGGVFEVVQAMHAGVFYYERVPRLEAQYRAKAQRMDDHETDMLWMIYQNRDVAVIGPANIVGAAA